VTNDYHRQISEPPRIRQIYLHKSEMRLGQFKPSTIKISEQKANFFRAGRITMVVAHPIIC
jgi:uncharacterized beta-barrel protein YwiB (DUF1934 family)